MISKFMKSNISKNEFFFGLVKVMTKFEKILKNDYHYIRLYKRKNMLHNLLKIALKIKKKNYKKSV